MELAKAQLGLFLGLNTAAEQVFFKLLVEILDKANRDGQIRHFSSSGGLSHEFFRQNAFN
jgi:hypothetical protein